MQEYKIVIEVTDERLNKRIADGWSIHTFGMAGVLNKMVAYALLEREKTEEKGDV